ncbi:MAG: glutamate 5-kinase [Actinobacteria bacterium]|nr:glutamate 5-kinase [Actinomycetota bacterium]
MRKDRWVIKLGSSILTDDSGRLDMEYFARIARDIAHLKKEGLEIVLVSSGAIAAGMQKLNITSRPKEMPMLQASAAVGQNMLMNAYNSEFTKYDLTVAQVLLTGQEMALRKQYLNARNTLITLIEMGIIPIVNENDTVAVEEIRFGDNDTLAAIVAGMVQADVLVILSNVDGLYCQQPDGGHKIIETVKNIDLEIENLAKGSGSALTVGGMVTKIKAAKIATISNIEMVIANGRKESILRDLLYSNAVCTRFMPAPRVINQKKRWIAFAKPSLGKLEIDEGAIKAITSNKKSLLLVGLVSIRGDFNQGETVDIISGAGELIGKGITNYSSLELKKYLDDRSTGEVNVNINYCKEIIHRDFMVVF